ncbi:MAG: DNA alkylation repair protein [Bacteroidales bacterium]|jgi:3-methyladenine DNA glycosylase AlkD|nr:DNA alkylation repair protein [Bacteroidales bacterium]MCK9498572.1 DNA alkylation repair protein [Bacteroidales bacterium]MDY0314468.1 DNA alkylation repair protein [Bacteroidales bacterium]
MLLPDYVRKIQDFFEKHRDKKEAEKMSKYMKFKFPFIGISAPKRKELFKIFFNTFPIPAYDETKAIVRELFNLPEREYHYFAVNMIMKHKKKWAPTDIVFFESLILNKSWWDSVDLISSKLVSPFFLKNRNLEEAITDSWSLSNNIWLKRVSIIYQNRYKKETNLDILTRHILENTDSEEFFIQKAIGWALRDYSKVDYKWVVDFVVNNSSLKPLSKREAIKWISDKGLIQ